MLPIRRRRRALAWAVVTVVLALVSGCSGDHPTSGDSTGHPPGHSDGDHAGHSGLAALPAPPASADWNLADATYLTMMIPHHRQALDLADLAEVADGDARVRAIARSIDRGQSREILVMAAWLVDRDLPEPTLDDVEAMYAVAGSPDGMAGMVSPDRMSALAAARGAEFDRLFLAAMIDHHRGAVEMADEVLAAGKDVRVTEMATDVIAVQNGEIRRMEDLLTALG